MKENIYNKKTREKKAAMYAAPPRPSPNWTDEYISESGKFIILFFQK